MTWKTATMKLAIRHAQVREIADGLQRPIGSEFDADVVCFTDGTAIEVLSSVSGSYSDVTPDVDVNDPVWRIYS